MNSLALTKLSFTFVFTAASYLPPFIGNTLRGALGRALHEHFRAVYEQVFKVTASASIPNPFVISAPFPSQGEYAPGEKLTFSIILFGSACGYDTEITKAVGLMNKGKLANTILTERVCEYASQWSDTFAATIPPCQAITLHFISPTELLSSKQPVYEPDFAMFTDSLLGRIAAICDNYGQSEFVIPYSLIAGKPQVKTVHNLIRTQIDSNSHPIRGFMGQISFLGDVTRYLPYIDLGSQLHLGKKTTRSCGEYYFTI